MVLYLLKKLIIGAWPVIIDEFVAYGKGKIDGEKMQED